MTEHEKFDDLPHDDRPSLMDGIGLDKLYIGSVGRSILNNVSYVETPAGRMIEIAPDWSVGEVVKPSIIKNPWERN
jgi:hypothetical protein